MVKISNQEIFFDKEDLPIFTRLKIDGKKPKLYFHRLIMNNPKKGLVVDHINRNKLDNRKSNLRIISWRRNILNHKLSSKNTSGSTGVATTKEGRWRSYATITNKNSTKKKQIHLGHFDSKEEAKLHSDIARLIIDKLYEIL